MLTLFSPAKINMFLRVLSRRDDGYHELATLMQAVTLGDILTLRFSSHDLFSCTDLSLECDPSNLVLRALKLFRSRTGYQKPLHIHLDKRIPMQAGLGGGSSNAATTLWALNRLYGAAIEESVLRQWGAELGADVPFFFSTGTAYCRGKGEDVVNCPPLPFAQYWLYKPIMGLSTKLMFQTLNLQTCVTHDPSDLLQSCYTQTPHFHNDFEQVAFKLSPELAKLREKLKPEFKFLWMTGSGTALIGMEAHRRPTGVPMQPCYRPADSWYRV